jgi:hypothetical protein
MKPFDEHPVSALRRHCRMYLYGSSGSPELLMNEVARDFFSFAMLHLICTMFITTDQRSDPAGGVFHRVLDPMGMSYLLTDIDRRLDSPIGNTTLRIFVRSKRNKLATHGRLAFSNHLPEVQAVTQDEDSLEQFRGAMSSMDQAVSRLEFDLARLESQEPNPDRGGPADGSQPIRSETESAARSRR